MGDKPQYEKKRKIKFKDKTTCPDNLYTVAQQNKFT